MLAVKDKKSPQALLPSRLAYLDNLKALMIIFVVITHAVITYTRPGLWYYGEEMSTGKVTIIPLVFYMFFTQAYFMSLLFLIAGYFVPASLEKKGSLKFLFDRAYRLGIPTLIYIFIVHAICIKLTRPNINLIDLYTQGVISLQFIEWTGPLWFTCALLIFNTFYVLIKKLFSIPDRISIEITTQNVLLLVALLTLITFSLRLFIPYGTVLLNFQVTNFPTYIVMFLLGTVSYQSDLFEKIDLSTAKKWFTTAFAVGLPLWILFLLLQTTGNQTIDRTLLSTFDGMHFVSLLFAFWESFFCVSIIIGLLGIFKEFYHTQNSFQRFLSLNAFGVYVFHPPIVISASLLLQDLALPMIVKILLVASISLPTTYLLTWTLREVPLLKKIFS